jgi:hypothetical protein
MVGHQFDLLFGIVILETVETALCISFVTVDKKGKLMPLCMFFDFYRIKAR